MPWWAVLVWLLVLGTFRLSVVVIVWLDGQEKRPDIRWAGILSGAILLTIFFGRK